jgi:hypothetical protein
VRFLSTKILIPSKSKILQVRFFVIRLAEKSKHAKPKIKNADLKRRSFARGMEAVTPLKPSPPKPCGGVIANSPTRSEASALVRGSEGACPTNHL